MIELEIPQGSDQWHEERHGCVTGTKIQQAVGAKYSKVKGWTIGNKEVQETLMMELVSDIQSELEIDDYCSEAMERGNELEPLSVDAASEKMGVKFEVCGMLQSTKHKRFKFSPDAVCKNQAGVIIGGYETKSKSGKKHIEYQVKNEVPSEHFWQCLCPMIMSDSVKWWAFGHYDDRNHINKLFTCGIKRSDHEELILEAREVLAKFFVDLDAMVIDLGGEYNG